MQYGRFKQYIMLSLAFNDAPDGIEIWQVKRPNIWDDMLVNVEPFSK